MIKRTVWAGLALLLSAALLLGNALPAGDTTRIPVGSSSHAPATPGLEAAQAISVITGVAISPLLGVSGVGVWKYFKTPTTQRASLPWYAQPWFWGPALFLVTLAFVKDTFGTALPTVIKKPFDVADAIENKISALVAAGAFVPLIAAIFSVAGDDSSSLLQGMGLAVIDASPLLNLFTIPAAIVAFVIVWMVSHVINVLVLISPFTTLDAALKSARLFVLTTVVGTAFVNPYLGAIWSLLIILFCCLVAGWAYRLMIFGMIFTWDMVTLQSGRFKVKTEPHRVFTARAIDKTPIRTYGRLRRDADGKLTLEYRPWPLWPRRSVTLPEENLVIHRGLLTSDVVQSDGRTVGSLLTLPPRYRSHEAEFNAFHRLGGVRDAGIMKGLMAFIRWLKGSLRFTPETTLVTEPG